MNKRLLSLGVLIITLVSGLSLWRYFYAPSSADPKDKILIAVAQVIEHPALDKTFEGFVDGMSRGGYVDGLNCKIVRESAQGNPALALQIAQKFVGQKAKLIVGLGTSTAQAAAKATENSPNIPIIFSSVTDPLGSKIVATLEKPGGNVTGVSNFVDPSKQMDVFKKILPQMKRLGVIYNPGEANSVSLVESMEKVAEQNGLTLVKAPASKTGEVQGAAQNLVGKTDAIFVNNDNTALAAFDAVVKVGSENQLPVFVSDVDLVKKGAIAALGANQYELGHQTARMAVRMLNGLGAPSTTPVEFPLKVKLELNVDVANKLDIEFMQDLTSSSERVTR